MEFKKSKLGLAELYNIKGIPFRKEIVFSIENNYPVPIFFCENLHIWMSAFEWNTKNIFYFKILEVVRHFMTNI